MSKAEELLSTAASVGIARLANAETEPHFIIDDKRIITVPNELKRIAVQYDHNIETVTFDCPRYWDDHDMSKMAIYINYLRVDKEAGFYKAQNITVDPDDSSIMHFEWTITRNVTEVYGQIAFLVCVRKADADGNEKNHWNSEICRSCSVSEGLEVDGEEIKELYPDIIDQWYQEVVAVLDEVNQVKQGLIDMRDSGQLDGATFIPSVDTLGNISWTNDRGRENPETRNIRGPDGISPVIQVTSIQGGHRLTITDINGTQYVDVMDTALDSTDAVMKLLNDFVYIGDVEPGSGPVLWFDTDATN